MTDDHTMEYRAVMRLMRHGLATQSEAAALAGLDRQLVRYWALQEGLDVPVLRRDYLRKLWRRFAKRP